MLNIPDSTNSWLDKQNRSSTITLMDMPQFLATYNGVAVNVDGVQANYGQCVQLVALFSEKVNGVTLPLVTGAVNLWNNTAVQKYYDQIPVGQPIQPGDIVIFNASAVINSPVYGHTDICVLPTSGGYLGFDSNWGGVTDQHQGTPGFGYPAAHEVQHSFTDVLGYLRLKGANDMVNDTICILSYQVAFNRSPSQGELDSWRGKPVVDMLTSLLANNISQRDKAANFDQVQAELKTLQSQPAQQQIDAIKKIVG